MTPAAAKKSSAKTRRKKGEAFEIQTVNKKTVTISQSTRKDHVALKWAGGQGYQFSVEWLREILEHIDEICTRYPEVWLHLTDGNDTPFYIQLQNGKLTLTENVVRDEEVSWALLKRALQSTIAEIRAS